MMGETCRWSWDVAPQADVEAHIGRRGVRFEREQHNGLNGADLPGASGSRVLHRDGAAKWSRKCRRRRRFFNQALARLIFLNETSTNMKLTKRSGWSPKRAALSRPRTLRRGKTQTFIAGLSSHGMVTPFIVNAPINWRIFET